MSEPFYAIGDVHGHAEALRRVLDWTIEDAHRAGLRRPRIVMMGDLSSRGPDSRGVLDLLCDPGLRRTARIEVLRGNHDAAMLSALEEPEGRGVLGWLHAGGADTVESYGISLRTSPSDALRSMMDAMPGSHLRLLHESRAFIDLGEMFLSHAGIDPTRPLHGQGPEGTVWSHPRFLETPGPFGATVVHGHFPTRSRRVEAMRHRIAMDTGAGIFTDGVLSAAMIGDGKPRQFGWPAPGALCPSLLVQGAEDAA